MPKRVLFAGLFHETHTFLNETTTLHDFQVHCGNEMLQCVGDSSPLGGALEIARKYGWDVIPTADYRASPSATVEDRVVEQFWRELESSLHQSVDAIYLVLHGAMVSQSMYDVEGEILERLRKVIGSNIPIFGVFDLHANFTQLMASNANCLVAYRENPHTDARQAAMIAAELLERSFTTGLVPQMFWRHPPVMWPPTGTGTAVDPMRSLERLARDWEARNSDLWAVNVCAGFSFADTPATGVSFAIASVGKESDAHAVLAELAKAAIDKQSEGNVTEPSIAEVFSQLDPLPAGLTVLVEPSDNIGGGAPGDGTGLLRALIDYAIQNAAIAINDPIAVQKLSKVTMGTRVTLRIGGHSSKIDAGPLELEVELKQFGSGLFQLEDKQSHLASMHGDSFDMGPCAVVVHGEITILLTSNKTPPFDLGQWRSQGIDPEKQSVIVVKAAVAHRRAYDPITARMFWVDTPGPCTSNLRMLPYQKVQRPLFPLDKFTFEEP